MPKAENPQNVESVSMLIQSYLTKLSSVPRKFDEICTPVEMALRQVTYEINVIENENSLCSGLESFSMSNFSRGFAHTHIIDNLL